MPRVYVPRDHLAPSRFRIHWTPEFVARGQRVSQTMRKTNLVLDDVTFNEIVREAKKQRHSFAAEARDLIETGLETRKMARR